MKSFILNIIMIIKFIQKYINDGIKKKYDKMSE